MRIVVVEDEVKIRQGIVNLIQKHTNHCIIAEASNGKAGLKAVKESQPDLIITDIKMPELNGIEMIEELRKEGVDCYCIILTGFSEFEYAQKAIKFGVCEYMLKPITAEDLIAGLEEISQKVKKDSDLEYKSLIVEKDLLYKLAAVNPADKEVIKYAKKLFEADETSVFTAVMVNFRENFEHAQEIIEEQIIKCFSDLENIKYYVIPMDEEIERLILIKEATNGTNSEELIKKKVIDPLKRAGIRHSLWTAVNFTGLEKLHENVKKLRELRMWAIAFGEDKLLSEKWIDPTKFSTLQYDVKLENKTKKALCNTNQEEVKKCLNAFISALETKIYHPLHIIEACTRYTAAILNIIKETNQKLYEQIEKKQYLKRVQEGKSLAAFDRLLEELAAEVMESSQKPESLSYAVTKAVNYIKSHYSEVISLEDIAQMLGITPVYLSGQFNKEVGVNFTQYIKELRIDKAKQLLLTTDLKLYEIGEKIGYQDPKYFCRVFKEVCGISPKTYRDMNHSGL